MKWLSNASIDELGNGLIKNYLGKRASELLFVDIDGFVMKYLNLPIVCERFAEDDMSKLGFISDGKTPLRIYSGNTKRNRIFPKGTIVIEQCLCDERETGRRRFTVAHEAAHYVADRSLAVASFHREYDNERTYSANDLKELFNINEANVDRLASALLMPEFMLRNYLKRSHREQGINIYDDGFIRPEDHLFIQTMAADMGVSVTALQIRIKQLGLYVKKTMNEYLAELGLGKEMVR